SLGIRAYAGQRVSPRRADRLAPRQAELRRRVRPVAQGPRHNALSPARIAHRAKANAGPRARAAFSVCHAGADTLAMAAQHAAGQGIALLDHVSDARQRRGGPRRITAEPAAADRLPRPDCIAALQVAEYRDDSGVA